jgi:hypothetical protein
MTIAQLAMNISNTSAVMAGQTKANAPARIPATPTTASHHRGAISPPLLAIAAHHRSHKRVIVSV